MDWSLVGVLVSIASLPLTLVGVYLRSIREQYQHVQQTIERLALEQAHRREWEQELVRMRERIDRLADMVSTLATRIRTDHSLLAELERNRRKLMILTGRESDALTKEQRP